jgi:hypothetical protein
VAAGVRTSSKWNADSASAWPLSDIALTGVRPFDRGARARLHRVLIDELREAERDPGVTVVQRGSPVLHAPRHVGELVVTLAGEPVPATPAITLALDTDGASVLTVECKPDKGNHPPTLSTPYTVDGSTIDIGVGTFSANCKDTDAQTLLQTYSFGGALATHPGTWSISADTLTITGHGQTVVFERSI